MADSNSNRVFFIRFGIVAVALHAFIGVLALIAWSVGKYERSPQVERALIEERIRPPARVVTSQAQLVRVVRAEQPAPNAAVAELSGDDVVAQFCASCHGPGLLDAPRTGDRAAWDARERGAGGVDELLASAIRGIGHMPPRGGAPQLSDAQLRAAIEVMRR